MSATHLAAVTAALTLSYAGMAGLCLAMPRHHRQVWSREPGARGVHLLRASGALALVFALIACAHGWGWAVGPVAWFGLLSAAAALLVLLLSYAPHQVGRLAAASALGGVLALGLALR